MLQVNNTINYNLCYNYLEYYISNPVYRCMILQTPFLKNQSEKSPKGLNSKLLSPKGMGVQDLLIDLTPFS